MTAETGVGGNSCCRRTSSSSSKGHLAPFRRGFQNASIDLRESEDCFDHFDHHQHTHLSHQRQGAPPQYSNPVASSSRSVPCIPCGRGSREKRFGFQPLLVSPYHTSCDGAAPLSAISCSFVSLLLPLRPTPTHRTIFSHLIPFGGTVTR